VADRIRARDVPLGAVVDTDDGPFPVWARTREAGQVTLSDNTGERLFFDEDTPLTVLSGGLADA
jgi:hypothetical protein